MLVQCPTTCQKSVQFLGSCAPSTFDCRDPAAKVDKAAPVIIAPAKATTSVARMLGANASADIVGAVASDNYPCFDGMVTFKDSVVGAYDCAAGVVRVIRRTFSATDYAGNVGTAQTDISVRDDVPPVLAGLPGSPNVSLPASYVRGGAMQRASNVTATDNIPECVKVAYSQQVLLDASPPPCAARPLYRLRRTWYAVDGANNTASYEQTVSVSDDEKLSLGTLVLQINMRNKTAASGVYTQAVRVPDPLPKKVSAARLRQLSGKWWLHLPRWLAGRGVSLHLPALSPHPGTATGVLMVSDDWSQQQAQDRLHEAR